MASVAAGTSLATTTNATAYTTPAFTPAEGELLVVICGIPATVANPTCSASANGITFGSPVIDQAWSGSAHTHAWFIAEQKVGASPASMTITVDVTGDAGAGGNVVVLRVSGMSKVGATAVRQATANTNAVGTGGTYTLTFGAATLTGNPIILALSNNSNPANMIAPSGFTELYDQGFATPTNGLHVSKVDSGQTSDSYTWGDTSATVGTANGLELDASASGIEQDVTPATETGAPQAQVAAKARTATPATETSSVEPQGRHKATSAASATESGTPVAAEATKSRDVGPVDETTEVVEQTANAGTSVTPAIETGTAVSQTAAKDLDVTTVGETGTVVAQTGGHNRTLSPATELGEVVAQEIGGKISATLTPAVETGEAQLQASAKAKATGAAAETSEVVAQTAARYVDAGVVDETAAIVPATSSKARSLTPTIEAGEAIAQGRDHARTITAVLETSTIPTATATKVLDTTAVDETSDVIAQLAVGGRPESPAAPSRSGTPSIITRTRGIAADPRINTPTGPGRLYDANDVRRYTP